MFITNKKLLQEISQNSGEIKKLNKKIELLISLIKGNNIDKVADIGKKIPNANGVEKKKRGCRINRFTAFAISNPKEITYRLLPEYEKVHEKYCKDIKAETINVCASLIANGKNLYQISDMIGVMTSTVEKYVHCMAKAGHIVVVRDIRTNKKGYIINKSHFITYAKK